MRAGSFLFVSHLPLLPFPLFSQVHIPFSQIFLFRRQPRNYENVTSEARRRKHFRLFLCHFFGCSTPSKRGVLVHKNSLAFCQRCRHSVEPRAVTCPFKQSNLSAWSLLSWHPTHTYLRRRLCFDLTKGLLFDTFVITVWYKLCPQWGHFELEFKSFSPLMYW